ncbi:MAG TPA: FMN-binding protein [Eubacteriaceae bacterium]|nr:FMN-binding protein [Eubacteriaceae bacterium]
MNSKKLILLMVLAVCLMAFAAGCGSDEGKYTDGTYEGSSDAGMHEGLVVEVEVTDGKIADVSIKEHQETEGVGTNAFEPISTAIVESQSTEVDIVSGATLTSNAMIEATEEALSQAE